MTSRRSARLQNREAQEPLEVQQREPIEAVRNNNKKRKSLAHSEGNTRTKKRATDLAIGRAKKPPSQAQFNSANNTLSSMPQEILGMILDNLEDPSTIGKLGRTCKRYYSLMMPLLHKRVAVAAMFHAHISKLIRGLEPHLTIAQKRQLKEEGKYKGQQAQYSSHLSADAKPFYTSYVRQIVAGVADPGQKHEYIVHRYVEEALKNMNNLEIVEVHFLTQSMAQSIASLENLQALRLLSSHHKVEAMIPLAKIKNLSHLSVENDDFDDNNIISSVVLNSKSTLRSLVVKTNYYATSFLQGWEKVYADDSLGKEKHSLAVLKAFTLCGTTFDTTFIKSLEKAIDFMGLLELTLGRFGVGERLFFQLLASLATSSQTSATSIGLRNLCLDMLDFSHSEALERQMIFETKCSFISAFDTLTTLEIKGYNQYPDTIATNPGLSDTLLEAILKHKNLRILKISYSGISVGRKIPYLSAKTVAAIIDNLPQLQGLEFAPEEAEINEIGEALARGTNLTSITCFPYDSWARYPRPEEPGYNILMGILGSFLFHDLGSGSGRFIWEDHYKLKSVSAPPFSWEIASKFGKSGKGVKGASQFFSAGGRGHNVFCRDISGTFPMHIHVGYDVSFAWVEKVAKDISGALR